MDAWLILVYVLLLGESALEGDLQTISILLHILGVYAVYHIATDHFRRNPR